MYKRQIYQIAESNRIEKNRFNSENRIESKLFFRSNWNVLANSAPTELLTGFWGEKRKGKREGKGKGEKERPKGERKGREKEVKRKRRGAKGREGGRERKRKGKEKREGGRKKEKFCAVVIFP